MSCEQYLQDIYLYDELSSEAREVIDKHVLTCSDCRTLLEKVQQQSAWMKHASSLAPPEARHPQQLTDAILARIERPTRRATLVTTLLAPMDSLFVRYSLAAISVGLLVFFLSEQQHGTVAVKTMYRPAASATLNTNEFLQPYTQEKEQRPPAPPSWYQCLRDESCVGTFLENRKQRKLSSL
jgi:predicted anti-sigma-YlaC factor YlaD